MKFEYYIYRCAPAGSCGGAICAANAECLWDNDMKIQYCQCPKGFIGDGVSSCNLKAPACDVRNNCGLYASCVRTKDSDDFECECDSGYIGDGLICIPEVNCINKPSLCDKNAKCITVHNEKTCVCNSGENNQKSIYIVALQRLFQINSTILLTSLKKDTRSNNIIVM